jgi:hypothetical protein
MERVGSGAVGADMRGPLRPLANGLSVVDLLAPPRWPTLSDIPVLRHGGIGLAQIFLCRLSSRKSAKTALAAARSSPTRERMNSPKLPAFWLASAKVSLLPMSAASVDIGCSAPQGARHAWRW